MFKKSSKIILRAVTQVIMNPRIRTTGRPRVQIEPRVAEDVVKSTAFPSCIEGDASPGGVSSQLIQRLARPRSVTEESSTDSTGSVDGTVAGRRASFM